MKNSFLCTLEKLEDAFMPGITAEDLAAKVGVGKAYGDVFLEIKRVSKERTVSEYLGEFAKRKGYSNIEDFISHLKPRSQLVTHGVNYAKMLETKLNERKKYGKIDYLSISEKTGAALNYIIAVTRGQVRPAQVFANSLTDLLDMPAIDVKKDIEFKGNPIPAEYIRCALEINLQNMNGALYSENLYVVMRTMKAKKKFEREGYAWLAKGISIDIDTVNKASIHQYISGKAIPKPERAKRIVDFLYQASL